MFVCLFVCVFCLLEWDVFRVSGVSRGMVFLLLWGRTWGLLGKEQSLGAKGMAIGPKPWTPSGSFAEPHVGFGKSDPLGPQVPF